MNIFSVLARVLLIYLVYKVVVNFVIPTFKSVGQLKGQMKQMQDRMNQQANAGNTGQANAPKKDQGIPDDIGEYIEFEEVKD
ncbi:MAG: hypothetical protein J5I50_02350 [Chitinophagaceae bacterium]|nr:hypothetical protein [Chitinophagaceae bacterium]